MNDPMHGSGEVRWNGNGESTLAAQGSVTDGSPVAGYAVGDDEGRFSVGMAGLLGVGVTAGLAFGLFAWLRPRDDTPTR